MLKNNFEEVVNTAESSLQNSPFCINNLFIKRHREVKGVRGGGQHCLSNQAPKNLDLSGPDRGLRQMTDKELLGLFPTPVC